MLRTLLYRPAVPSDVQIRCIVGGSSGGKELARGTQTLGVISKRELAFLFARSLERDYSADCHKPMHSGPPTVLLPVTTVRQRSDGSHRRSCASPAPMHSFPGSINKLEFTERDTEARLSIITMSSQAITGIQMRKPSRLWKVSSAPSHRSHPATRHPRPASVPLVPSADSFEYAPAPASR